MTATGVKMPVKNTLNQYFRPLCAIRSSARPSDLLAWALSDTWAPNTANFRSLDGMPRIAFSNVTIIETDTITLIITIMSTVTIMTVIPTDLTDVLSVTFTETPQPTAE